MKTGAGLPRVAGMMGWECDWMVDSFPAGLSCKLRWLLPFPLIRPQWISVRAPPASSVKVWISAHYCVLHLQTCFSHHCFILVDNNPTGLKSELICVQAHSPVWLERQKFLEAYLIPQWCVLIYLFLPNILFTILKSSDFRPLEKNR